MAIVLSDNIQANAPKSIDSRYLNNLVPYTSVSAANAAILSGVRFTGLTVNILGTEYWYGTGVLDACLVTKSAGGTWGSITGVLSGQTDLQTCLNGKLASGGTAICATTAGNALCLGGHLPAYYLNTGTTITCAADSAKLNNKLPAYYLNTGSTALCATIAGNSLKLGNNLPAYYLNTGSTITCAADSAKLNNKLPAYYLNTGSTACNSLALCGCIPVCFLGATACACDSKCLGGHLPAYYLNTGTTITCAADSAKLNNKLPAYYLNTGSTALCATTAGNALALCGCTPACFLGATATAVCATCAIGAKNLCGCVPASFLLSGGTAKNSTCLNGQLASYYAPIDSPNFTTCICTPVMCSTGVVKGTIISGSSCVESPVIRLTTGAGAGCVFTSNATGCGIWCTPSSSIAWSGTTANGVGTYYSSTCIKSQPNMTFDGTKLGVTGNICASTCLCSPIVCAITCFVGSGAGLTGTAASLTVGTATNATCLGGNLAACYAPKLSPILGCLVTINECAFYAGPTLGSVCGSLILNSCNCLNGLAVGVSSNGDTWFQSQRFDANTATYNIILQMCGGNVGIGTAAPQKPLHVIGTMRLERVGENYVDTSFTGGAVTGDAIDLIFIPGTNETLGYQFQTYNGSSFVCALNISKVGNIGVGITTPTSKLHISSAEQYPLVINNSYQPGGVGTPQYYGALKFTGGGYDWSAIQTIQNNPSASWSNRLAFSTMSGNGGALAERMAIDNTGNVCIGCNVGIGCTVPSVALDVCGDIKASGNVAIGGTPLPIACLGGANATTMQIYACCYPQALYVATCVAAGNRIWRTIGRGTVFQIQSLDDNGSNEATGVEFKRAANAVTCVCFPNGQVLVGSCVTATDFIATSDCRLKTCIKPIMGALSTVMQLQGVNYQLCDDEKQEKHLGLIAQDVQKVLPEIVSHSTPNENDAKYGITDDKLGLKYDKLSAVLIEAIKEQQKQIKEQEKQLHCLCMELNYMRNSNC